MTVYSELGLHDPTIVAAIAAAVDTSAGRLSGTVDPTAGAGVVAPIGSSYRRTADGTMWMKTGAGDTDWQQLAFVAP